MPASLPAGLRLGAAHLVVADLDRSVVFYEDVLGLQAGEHGDAQVALGTGGEEPVLVLHERPGARRAGRHAGLFHVALLHPSREELARAALRLAAGRVAVSGASDHLTHEAIYLSDPDGNGLELAADRPRAQWPPPEQSYGAGPQPLDLPRLLAAVEAEAPRRHAGAGLGVGHVHLRVGDVERGLAFYRDLLGFELVAHLGSAAFVSAGGYHHHLAFNVWHGRGVGPVPEGVAGLREWTILLETPAEVGAVRDRLRGAGVDTEDREGGFGVRDPWGIPAVVRVAAGQAAAPAVRRATSSRTSGATRVP